MIFGADTTGRNGRLGNLVGAVDADEFFDQIHVALEISTEGWNRHFPTFRTIRLAMHRHTHLQGFECLLDLGIADIKTDELTDVVRLDFHFADGLNELTFDNHRAIDGATGHFEDQINRAECGILHTLRVDATLEAIGTVSGQRQLTGSRTHGARIEISGFEHDIGGGLLHFGIE